MGASDYCFPVFKGLQKPLEFMGLRGRSMIHAAAAFGTAFLGYCVGVFCVGQLVGAGIAAVVVAIALPYVYIKQKQGLHTKKRSRDTLIFQSVFIRK